MSEMAAPTITRDVPKDAPTSRRPCRRMIPDTYRCACGRVRDRCVRASVRALWSADPVRPARPARP
ncbi:hypothetical protein GA0074695_5696 [Micromonospora viridifaciens]|uniref:Uncharacterized protein n=1 Tax=Micromonospora viridifaciens TaxID=1881 RepID=A0A1C4ZJA0_MICVI|nr:hypothetical protein GA0074695_5696 [Micromonospora viridifaciens]